MMVVVVVDVVVMAVVVVVVTTTTVMMMTTISPCVLMSHQPVSLDAFFLFIFKSDLGLRHLKQGRLPASFRGLRYGFIFAPNLFGTV